MRFIPTTGREWGALVLFPFKAYVVIAFVSFFVLGSALPSHSGVPPAAVNLVCLYFYCAIILLIGGFCQLSAGAKRESFASFAWSVAAFLVGFFLAPMVAQA
jgi:hypothetical protein